jgi:hypothetical protein
VSYLFYGVIVLPYLEKPLLDLCRAPDYIDFLKKIVEYRVLDYPAHGIAQKVIAGGASEFSEKQARVFKWYVYRPFKKPNCAICAKYIPMDEMFNCIARGYLCEDCFAIHAE